MKLNTFFKATLAATLLIISAARAEHFAWRNLQSDIHGVAPGTDENLVNPWDIAVGPDGHRIWVANNGTGTATVYDALGKPVPVDNPLVVSIPAATQGFTGTPTGLVRHLAAFGATPSSDFIIHNASMTVSGSAKYLFCSEDGVISGWNPDVDATNARIVVDNSANGAVYKGMAISHIGEGAVRLYVANFKGGKIEVYDGDFAPDTALTTKINAADLAPIAGYAPYNIKHYAIRKAHSVSRYLIVAYAKQDSSGAQELHGAGLGYINVFDSAGNFVKRLVDVSLDANNPNDLNAPWGMAISRHQAGASDDVLFVGNFGDGKIHRYRLGGNFSGTPRGSLKDAKGVELQFDGLWALHFGSKVQSEKIAARDTDELDEPDSVLFFTAGIADEGHGLFGVILRR